MNVHQEAEDIAHQAASKQYLDDLGTLRARIARLGVYLSDLGLLKSRSSFPPKYREPNQRLYSQRLAHVLGLNNPYIAMDYVAGYAANEVKEAYEILRRVVQTNSGNLRFPSELRVLGKELSDLFHYSCENEQTSSVYKIFAPDELEEAHKFARDEGYLVFKRGLLMSKPNDERFAERLGDGIKKIRLATNTLTQLYHREKRRAGIEGYKSISIIPSEWRPEVARGWSALTRKEQPQPIEQPPPIQSEQFQRPWSLSHEIEEGGRARRLVPYEAPSEALTHAGHTELVEQVGRDPVPSGRPKSPIRFIAESLYRKLFNRQ